MLLALGKVHPILVVLCKVDFLSSPKGCLMLLVHLPHFWILKWEHHPTTRVFLQQRVLLLQFLVLVGDGALLWHWRQELIGGLLRQCFVQITWQVHLIVASDGAIWSNECVVWKSRNMVAGWCVLVHHRCCDTASDAMLLGKAQGFIHISIHANQDKLDKYCSFVLEKFKNNISIMKKYNFFWKYIRRNNYEIYLFNNMNIVVILAQSLL